MLLTPTNAIMEITGKPATIYYGTIAPGIGKTTLTLQADCLIEQTHYRCLGLWFGSRHCEVPRSRVDSYELLERGNPIWWALGISLAVPTIGISLVIFGILFFLMKKRYFVVRSSGNTLAIALDTKADLERARVFMNELRTVHERQTPRSQESPQILKFS